MKLETDEYGDNIFFIDVPVGYIKQEFDRLKNRLGDEKFKNMVKIILRGEQWKE